MSSDAATSSSGGINIEGGNGVVKVGYGLVHGSSIHYRAASRLKLFGGNGENGGSIHFRSGGKLRGGNINVLSGATDTSASGEIGISSSTVSIQIGAASEKITGGIRFMTGEGFSGHSGNIYFNTASSTTSKGDALFQTGEGYVQGGDTHIRGGDVQLASGSSFNAASGTIGISQQHSSAPEQFVLNAGDSSFETVAGGNILLKSGNIFGENAKSGDVDIVGGKSENSASGKVKLLSSSSPSSGNLRFTSGVSFVRSGDLNALAGKTLVEGKSNGINIRTRSGHSSGKIFVSTGKTAKTVSGNIYFNTGKSGQYNSGSILVETGNAAHNVGTIVIASRHSFSSDSIHAQSGRSLLQSGSISLHSGSDHFKSGSNVIIKGSASKQTGGGVSVVGGLGLTGHVKLRSGKGINSGEVDIISGSGSRGGNAELATHEAKTSSSISIHSGISSKLRSGSIMYQTALSSGTSSGSTIFTSGKGSTLSGNYNIFAGDSETSFGGGILLKSAERDFIKIESGSSDTSGGLSGQFWMGSDNAGAGVSSIQYSSGRAGRKSGSISLAASNSFKKLGGSVFLKAGKSMHTGGKVRMHSSPQTVAGSGKILISPGSSSESEIIMKTGVVNVGQSGDIKLLNGNYAGPTSSYLHFKIGDSQKSSGAILIAGGDSNKQGGSIYVSTGAGHSYRSGSVKLYSKTGDTGSGSIYFGYSKSPELRVSATLSSEYIIATSGKASQSGHINFHSGHGMGVIRTGMSEMSSGRVAITAGSGNLGGGIKIASATSKYSGILSMTAGFIIRIYHSYVR
jgi:hypothetical protein